MAEAWAASSEAWLSAGDQALAYERLQRAYAANPRLVNVGLLALDLMASYPDTEAIVKKQLADAPSPVLRLSYARKLLAAQRVADAAVQLDGILAQQPDNAMAWLTLGAVRMELKQLDPAEQAIRRFLVLAAAQAEAAKSDPAVQAVDIDLGYLRMAQISEMRKQPRQADEWLRKADPAGEKISVQVARARLLAAQGKLPEARTLIKSIPEAEPRDALVKINAEAQLLREAKQLDAALKLLSEAGQRFPDDADLIYDQAMLADALKRYDESEALLRKVITLRPDHPHAYNALGYSLTDRGIRLDEARTYIQKALSLRPGDPFITDSLGWLEFRAGRVDDAVKWLRQAYVAKSDSEIAAHLGEALWVQGQRDEALRIWREGLATDASNETLQSTIKRLQARP
jgi:Flp pilus assembly protein TadD